MSKQETDNLTLTIENQSLKKKLEQQENEAFAEISRLTKDLSQTRTYLQSKEEEVVMMRKEKAEAQKLMDQAQADAIMVENRELQRRIAEMEKQVQEANEGQKALILQRKTLISNKESVQKELDKVLRKTETDLAEKDKQVKEKTMAYEAMKMESDATIQQMRDQKTQAGQMNERLFNAREILEKERDELRASLNKKVKESLMLEETLREQLLHKGKRVESSGFGGLLKAFDLDDVHMVSKET